MNTHVLRASCFVHVRRADEHIHMHLQIAYTHALTHTSTHALTHTYTHALTHTYTHAYTYTHALTHWKELDLRPYMSHRFINAVLIR